MAACQVSIAVSGENYHPGCKCKDGFVLNHEYKCVQRSDCKCRHKDKYYDAGAKLPIDCNDW